jgi:hypothetical protein
MYAEKCPYLLLGSGVTQLYVQVESFILFTILHKL